MGGGTKREEGAFFILNLALFSRPVTRRSMRVSWSPNVEGHVTKLTFDGSFSTVWSLCGCARGTMWSGVIASPSSSCTNLCIPARTCVRDIHSCFHGHHVCTPTRRKCPRCGQRRVSCAASLQGPSSCSVLPSSLELRDTTIYEPSIRALLGTASHSCRAAFLRLLEPGWNC